MEGTLRAELHFRHLQRCCLEAKRVVMLLAVFGDLILDKDNGQAALVVWLRNRHQVNHRAFSLGVYQVNQVNIGGVAWLSICGLGRWAVGHIWPS